MFELVDISREVLSHPNYHTLTEADFTPESAPSVIEQWEPWQNVTRPRVLGFLMYAFGESHGVPDAQSMITRRARAKIGLDITTTFQALKAAGGWRAFSPDEQAKFLRAFTAVGAHLQKYDPEQYESVIIEEFIYLPDGQYADKHGIDYAGISDEDFEARLRNEIMNYKQHKLHYLFDA